MNNTIKIGDYNKVISDRNIFNQIVYTPLSEAVRLLEERRKDTQLVAKIENLLKGDIPDFLKDKKCGIFARHIATPNFDTQRFIKLTKENDLETVFLEYLEDKFTSGNDFKHSLGQIRVQNGFNKHGDHALEKINVIDMVKHDGKKLSGIKTLWGESLVDFHKKLFKHYELSEDLIFFDISKWYSRNGGNAEGYYKNVLLLFIAHGILFENFLTSGKEGDFSKTVVLPAIENVMNLVGLKPLIVPLSLIEVENEEYWISHPSKVKDFIQKN